MPLRGYWIFAMAWWGNASKRVAVWFGWYSTVMFLTLLFASYINCEVGIVIVCISVPWRACFMGPSLNSITNRRSFSVMTRA